MQAFLASQASAIDPERLLELFVDLFEAIRPPMRKRTAIEVENYTRLISYLEQDAVLAAAVRDHLLTLLTSRRLVRFFADSGILPATGFFSELGRILTDRLLPEVLDEGEFQDCLRRVFHRPDDWVWLDALPPELTQRFWSVLAETPGTTYEASIGYLANQMIDAMLLLAYRISGLSSEPEFNRLGARFARHANRFQSTAAAAQRYADALRAGLDERRMPQDDAGELIVLLDQCREALDDGRRIALRHGTSLRLTYLLRRSRQTLRRIELLTELLATAGDTGREKSTLTAWSTLVREALRMEARRNSPRQHISQGIEILALRVTDNAAKTGEHYIAESRPQYLRMWRAAAGAGVIIACLALLKIFTGMADLAPAGYALLYSLIYGLGFVLIYMLHMTIATKQPAMTAQTIAGYLGSAEQGRVNDLERVVDLFAAVTRSQLAAILGNVLLALPTALLIGYGLSRWKGSPILDAGEAEYLLHALDPLGWAIPHAAIAGVFLFLAGLISGYFDNRASFSRIGIRVANLRWLRNTFSTARAERVGTYVEDHLGGLMGNFLFGCMLGSAGTIGVILGLPIDIRHVAFAAANLGYALQAFDFALPWQTVAWTSLGVALIGFTNLTVSFALALRVSLKARDAEFSKRRELLRRLWLRFKARPGSFLLPKGKTDTNQQGPA